MKRVLVVEDSPTARRYVCSMLSASVDFEVVAVARTGEEALRAAAALAPDLVSLDVFLPDLTAAEVVRRLLLFRPVPVLLLSNAPRDADDVFRALEAGAVDFLPKPSPHDPRGAALVLNALRELVSRAQGEASSAGPVPLTPRGSVCLVVVASSTGGPPALKTFLSGLPRGFTPPVLVAQHLTPGFEEGLARWLALSCPLPVKVLKGRTALEPGVYLGQPHHDLLLRNRGEAECVVAPERGYHPSGDLLFESAATHFGAGVVAVVLSGIGSDGQRGAGFVQRAGGLVFAQSLTSAAVRGMPQSVIKAGLTSLNGTPEALATRLAMLAPIP